MPIFVQKIMMPSILPYMLVEVTKNHPDTQFVILLICEQMTYYKVFCFVLFLSLSNLFLPSFRTIHFFVGLQSIVYSFYNLDKEIKA